MLAHPPLKCTCLVKMQCAPSVRHLGCPYMTPNIVIKLENIYKDFAIQFSIK